MITLPVLRLLLAFVPLHVAPPVAAPPPVVGAPMAGAVAPVPTPAPVSDGGAVAPKAPPPPAPTTTTTSTTSTTVPTPSGACALEWTLAGPYGFGQSNGATAPAGTSGTWSVACSDVAATESEFPPGTTFDVYPDQGPAW